MRPHTCITKKEVEEKYAKSTPEEFAAFIDGLSTNPCPFCKRAVLLAELKKPEEKKGD